MLTASPCPPCISILFFPSDNYLQMQFPLLQNGAHSVSTRPSCQPSLPHGHPPFLSCIGVLDLSCLVSHPKSLSFLISFLSWIFVYVSLESPCPILYLANSYVFLCEDFPRTLGGGVSWFPLQSSVGLGTFAFLLLDLEIWYLIFFFFLRINSWLYY